MVWVGTLLCAMHGTPMLEQLEEDCGWIERTGTGIRLSAKGRDEMGTFVDLTVGRLRQPDAAHNPQHPNHEPNA